MSGRGISWPAAGARHLFLLATTCLVLLPFVWMVSLSLKPPGEIFRAQFQFLPDQLHAVENFTRALTAVPLPRFLLNGLLICTVTFALQMLVAAPAAYALAKLRFPGRDALFGLVLVGLLLPDQVLAIPLFVMLHFMGLLDSYAAIILPNVISPFGIFLLRQFFRTVPDDLVHAARLDGVSELAVVWRIMVPVALPAVIAFGIFSVVGRWNDLFWPLIVIRSEELAPPPLGVVFFRSEEAGSDYGPLMAGAVLVAAPLVIAFLLAQRRFVEGLTAGSVK